MVAPEPVDPAIDGMALFGAPQTRHPRDQFSHSIDKGFACA